MMTNFHSILTDCERTIQFLDHELKTLEIEMGPKHEFTARAVELCGAALKKLKEIVIATGFENLNEEVFFFKVLKPRVNSRLFYYLAVYKIQISQISGNNEFMLEILNKEKNSAKSFIHENFDFYQYYHSGSMHLDFQYFIRGRLDLLLVVRNPLIFEDPLFSTSHDYLLSIIIANEMLLEFLETEIKKLSYSKIDKYDNNFHDADEKLFWTDAKNALIELLYALYCIRAINNGNIDIKRLGKFFGRVLNIDLGDLYHAFSEMKMRKKERTKYLDSLRDALIKRMDESDEK